MLNRKNLLSTAVAAAMGGVSFSASAALTTGTHLRFTLGQVKTVACNYGTMPPCNKASYAQTDIVGSYFGMDTNRNGPEPNEKTPIGPYIGIHMGTVQAASGSHGGSINGTENPNIDSPWTFFGNTGMHQTTSPIVDLTGSGAVRTLDFSGWNVTWNGIPSIPLIDNGTTITCSTASCSNGNSYTIDGSFTVSGVGFTGVAYTLHLEGLILTPIPAAVWLFGSGMMGLAVFTRRRRRPGTAQPEPLGISRAGSLLSLFAGHALAARRRCDPDSGSGLVVRLGQDGFRA